MEGTGWEIAVLIRDSVIQDQIQNISERNAASSRKHIIFTLIAVLLLAAVLLLQLGDLAKDKIEEERLLFSVFGGASDILVDIHRVAGTENTGNTG